LKCGLTTVSLNKRISNLNTSLFYNCDVVYITDTLIDCKFYEFVLHSLLKDFRVRIDREFFDIDQYVIKDIFDTFNHVNSNLNSEEKLHEYISNNYPQYLLRKKINNKYHKKPKIKRGLFVDTSSLYI
jgi:hypothetical protein